MLYLIHGDDIVSSRSKLGELLKDSPWTIRFEAEKDSLEKIIDATVAQELFSDRKTIVIECITRLQSTQVEKIVNSLIKAQNRNDLDIVIWNGRELDKNILKKCNDAQVFLYSFPKYYYSFLDSVFPNNMIKSREFLSRVKEQITDEQIFYGLVRRVRLLMLVRASNIQDIADLKTLAPWQIGKLKKQSRPWKDHELIGFYQTLYALEVGLKTSSLPMSLVSHIEVLLSIKL